MNRLEPSAAGSIAPKQSPTTSGRSRRPPRHSSARPSAITKNVSVSSPSPTICAFSGTSTSTAVPASARTSRGFSGVNARIASACVPNPTCLPAPSSARCSLRPVPSTLGALNRPLMAASTAPPTSSVLPVAPVPSSLMRLLSSPTPAVCAPPVAAPLRQRCRSGGRGANGARRAGGRYGRWTGLRCCLCRQTYQQINHFGQVSMSCMLMCAKSIRRRRFVEISRSRIRCIHPAAGSSRPARRRRHRSPTDSPTTSATESRSPSCPRPGTGRPGAGAGRGRW